MLQQKRLVCFPIKPPAARVNPFLTKKTVKSAREQIMHSSALAEAFEYALVQEIRKPRRKVRRDRFFPMDEVHDQKIFRAECGQALTPDLFNKPQELRILDLAV